MNITTKSFRLYNIRKPGREDSSVDYIAIGKRIRKFRKEMGKTQDQIAEKANMTSVHYSHIETGNTKASLPSFIKIANALEVGVDDLLADNLQHVKHVSLHEMDVLLEDCSDAEAKALVKIVTAAKTAIREMKLPE